MEKTHAETRGSENDTGLTAQCAQTHTQEHASSRKHKSKPTTCVTHSFRERRSDSGAEKKNAARCLCSHRRHMKYFLCKQKHTLAITLGEMGDSQKISLYLQHRQILPHGKTQRAHAWQSGNASGPLKPKPIRSLM